MIADHHARIVFDEGCFVKRVIEPFRAGFVEMELRPEWGGVEFAFGTLVDYASLVAAKGAAVGIILDEVLLDFRTDHFEEITKVSEDREVSKESALSLEDIVVAQENQRNDEEEKGIEPGIQKSRAGPGDKRDED
jgi:hypothetical protein